MSLHAARLEFSPRLQRVADLLADGAEHTTMDIIQAAGVCAVNSIVAELRSNGLHILCRRCGDVWVYWQPDRSAGGPPARTSDQTHEAGAPPALQAAA